MGVTDLRPLKKRRKARRYEKGTSEMAPNRCDFMGAGLGVSGALSNPIVAIGDTKLSPPLKSQDKKVRCLVTSATAISNSLQLGKTEPLLAEVRRRVQFHSRARSLIGRWNKLWLS
jgi:hypothetical protein